MRSFGLENLSTTAVIAPKIFSVSLSKMFPEHGQNRNKIWATPKTKTLWALNELSHDYCFAVNAERQEILEVHQKQKGKRIDKS